MKEFLKLSGVCAVIWRAEDRYGWKSKFGFERCHAENLHGAEAITGYPQDSSALREGSGSGIQ